MTITEQADALLDRAQPYVDAGTGNGPLAQQIRDFLTTGREALTADGGGDRIDQLEAAAGWLSGNGPGQASPQQSPTAAGVTSYLNDRNKIDTQYFKDAYQKGKDALLHDPLLLGIAVVAVVFVAAYAWRALK